MNKATIESIKWHKDQIFKLLEDGDLIKIEGDIYSVKKDLNGIIEKAKAKKRVWVKATATKKGHYREMEVGRKEEEKVGYEERVMSKEKQRKEWGGEIKSLAAERDRISDDMSKTQDVSESYLKEMGRQINSGENISATRTKYEASQKSWRMHNDKMNAVNDKIRGFHDKIDASYD